MDRLHVLRHDGMRPRAIRKVIKFIDITCLANCTQYRRTCQPHPWEFFVLAALTSGLLYILRLGPPNFSPVLGIRGVLIIS
jgi:hypothetical protein